MNLKQAPPEHFGRIGAFFYRLGAERSLAPYYTAVAAAVAERLPGLPPAPVDVLDLGCGPGALTRRLAATPGPPTVVGVDAALTMLRQARRAAPSLPAGHASVTLLAGQVEALPLPEGAVRLALASLSFHHWEEPEAALAEIHRVLVPGGEVWVFEPDPEFSREALDRGMRRLLGIWPPARMLRRAFSQHGFTTAEYPELVAPAVARTPFLSMVGVEPFLWLRRMVLRRGGVGVGAEDQAGAMRTPGTSSSGTAA
jgi:ubiquinone/menaquinone biosynthesis C-methylase UbiE